MHMRCPYSPNYIGCWSNTEYNTRLPLQCSRSWQHNSRATLPTSPGFVLLHANFGPAEGICYMTNLAFADRAFSHAAPAVWNSLPLDIVTDLFCLATFKRLVKTELYNRAYLRWFVTTRSPALTILHFVNDLTCVINRVIIMRAGTDVDGTRMRRR